MLEVRETPGSTFGVFDTEKDDYFRNPDGVIVTRDTLAGANHLLQSLRDSRVEPLKKPSRFHTYTGLRRDLIITAGLILLLVIFKTIW